MVSGRPIGATEPDIPKVNCSGKKSGQGIPIPIKSGCGFKTLLDSAIYAANLLKGKVAGDLNGYQQIIKALGKYNHARRGNCNNVPQYKGCPKHFDQEDHPYALNLFDKRHTTMYLIKCSSGCPKPDKRAGSFTAAQIALSIVK